MITINNRTYEINEYILKARFVSKYSETTVQRGWIASKFEGANLPQEVVVGDGRRTNDFFNRPLPKGHNYVAVLRALLEDNVGGCKL